MPRAAFRPVVAIAVAALFAAAAARAADAPKPAAQPGNDPPFAARILDAISVLQAKVDNLQSTVGALQGTVGNVQGTVGNLQKAVDAVQADTIALQSSVAQVMPAWSQILPANARFASVLKGAAILDQETGLVWEKSPDLVPIHLWNFAQQACNPKVVGGRSGWRLPTIQELQSLVDPSVTGTGPKLPPGHPFLAFAGDYWSATTGTPGDNDKNLAWVTSLESGFPHEIEKDQNSSARPPVVWCVRAGQGSDPQ
jgi:hypothetical protein